MELGMDYGMLIEPVVQVITSELILWPCPLNCNFTSLCVSLTKFGYLQLTERCSSRLFAKGVCVVFVKSFINLDFRVMQHYVVFLCYRLYAFLCTKEAFFNGAPLYAL